MYHFPMEKPAKILIFGSMEKNGLPVEAVYLLDLMASL